MKADNEGKIGDVTSLRSLHGDQGVHLSTPAYWVLIAERDALKAALERINLRFYNFDNQHPSLCTNEAARQLLAEIEADIADALSKVAP